jgi:hypothetical protein
MISKYMNEIKENVKFFEWLKKVKIDNRIKLDKLKPDKKKNGRTKSN